MVLVFEDYGQRDWTSGADLRGTNFQPKWAGWTPTDLFRGIYEPHTRSGGLCWVAAYPRLPENLDLVDDLAYTVQPNHRRLGKLFQIETRHLAPKEKSAFLKLTPDPLHGKTSVRPKPLPGHLSNSINPEYPV